MATGDSLAVFNPQSAELPPSNFATFDTRNVILILDFDDSTDESVDFAGFMPRHYDGGGITVTVGWMATTATTGNAVLNVAFKSISDDADDVDTKPFATANALTATTASVSGEVKYSEITFTDGADMDSIAAGEYFRMKILRDADNGSDTMSGDMELVFAEIKET